MSEDYTRGLQEGLLTAAEKWGKRTARAELRCEELSRAARAFEERAHRAERSCDELQQALPFERARGYLQALYDMGSRDITVKPAVFDDYIGGLVRAERYVPFGINDNRIAFRDAKVARGAA